MAEIHNLLCSRDIPSKRLDCPCLPHLLCREIKTTMHVSTRVSATLNASQLAAVVRGTIRNLGGRLERSILDVAGFNRMAAAAA